MLSVHESIDGSVSGEVNTISFYPGESGLLGIDMQCGYRTEYYHLSTEQPESELYADGESIKADELYIWLLEHRCNVTLYPLMERYGMSFKAEFVSVKD